MGNGALRKTKSLTSINAIQPVVPSLIRVLLLGDSRVGITQFAWAAMKGRERIFIHQGKFAQFHSVNIDGKIVEYGIHINCL